MTEVDELARRAVEGVVRLAARATRFASYVFVAAVLIGTTSFLLGLAALDGSVRTVWIVLGLGFGAVAVRRRVRAPAGGWARSAYHVSALVAEVVSLLEFGHPATRTMVDTVEADEREGGGSVLVVSREFYSLRDAIDSRAYEYPLADVDVDGVDLVSRASSSARSRSRSSSRCSCRSSCSSSPC